MVVGLWPHARIHAETATSVVRAGEIANSHLGEQCLVGGKSCRSMEPERPGSHRLVWTLDLRICATIACGGN
jgi:hypothetical protein